MAMTLNEIRSKINNNTLTFNDIEDILSQRNKNISLIAKQGKLKEYIRSNCSEKERSRRITNIINSRNPEAVQEILEFLPDYINTSNKKKNSKRIKKILTLHNRCTIKIILPYLFNYANSTIHKEEYHDRIQIMLASHNSEVIEKIVLPHLKNYLDDKNANEEVYAERIERILRSRNMKAIEEVLLPYLPNYINNSLDKKTQDYRIEKIITSHNPKAVKKISLPLLINYISQPLDSEEHIRRLEKILASHNPRVTEEILLPYLPNYINFAPDEKVRCQRIEKILATRNYRIIEKISLTHFIYYLNKAPDKKEYFQRIEKILFCHDCRIIKNILGAHLISYLDHISDKKEYNQHIEKILASKNVWAIENTPPSYLSRYINNASNKKEYTQRFENILVTKNPLAIEAMLPHIPTYLNIDTDKKEILNRIEKILITKNAKAIEILILQIPNYINNSTDKKWCHTLIHTFTELKGELLDLLIEKTSNGTDALLEYIKGDFWDNLSNKTKKCILRKIGKRIRQLKPITSLRAPPDIRNFENLPSIHDFDSLGNPLTNSWLGVYHNKSTPSVPLLEYINHISDTERDKLLHGFISLSTMIINLLIYQATNNTSGPMKEYFWNGLPETIVNYIFQQININTQKNQTLPSGEIDTEASLSSNFTYFDSSINLTGISYTDNLDSFSDSLSTVATPPEPAINGDLLIASINNTSDSEWRNKLIRELIDLTNLLIDKASQILKYTGFSWQNLPKEIVNYAIERINSHVETPANKINYINPNDISLMGGNCSVLF